LRIFSVRRSAGHLTGWDFSFYRTIPASRSPEDDDSVDRFRLEGYYTELVLLPDSPLIGKTIRELA
jgi:hypothetical protein